ncbi:hypothetical protein K0B96_09455 [Horticoccus luteus]|uniref:Uncharacterized protein n=1 Tax=Horticoccus luteus TaxID=2862869 RepID=A0A8F9TTL2_9BACT|nr:hypothetical protein [Horticoccus luteus]QYM77554.1 hypothetical protein K0B96_09455 [Horticoccus luteus]
MVSATGGPAAGNSVYDLGSKAIAGAGGVQTAVGLVGTTGASIGSNGKVYTSGWGGNQYVTTAKFAEIATKAGFVLAAAGTAWDWINVFNGSGSISGTKATVNTGFTGLGLLGGPMGAAGGAGYFLIDNFYPGGWLGNGSNQPYNGAGALRDYGTTIENNQKIVPGWEPRDPPF